MGRAALILTTMLVTGGCTPLIVAEMVLDADTTASVTVSGPDQDLDLLLYELASECDVETTIHAVHTGARVVEIVGTYVAVLDAVSWMMVRGLSLVANDTFTEAILYAVLK